MRNSKVTSSFLAVALISVCTLGGARAQAEAWHVFGGVDIFGAGNASKHNQDALTGVCKEIIGYGFTRCAYSVTTDGAYGARGGALMDVGGVMVGPSLGYLYGGPSGAGKANLTTTPAGTVDVKSTDHTLRLLGEAHKSFTLSDPWAVSLGGGLGMAVDFHKETCSATGALAGSGCSTNTKLGWATWELAPAVWYKSAFLALRYAGFLRSHQLPWNTFGLSIGGRFS